MVKTLQEVKEKTSSNMLLTVVIINYCTPDMTLDCLESLLPELYNLSACVVLVDNDSGDDSAHIIKKWLAKHDTNSLVTFIESPLNGGFSSGNNIGMNEVKSEFYLLLNSDTLVKKGSIQQLMNFIIDKKSIGLVTPRLEWKNSTSQVSCFRFMSPISEFISSAQTGIFTKLFKSYDVPIPVSDKVSYPAWSSFACILIRKEVFDDIGLMDVGYFMYFEDAEFCFRARKSGWEIAHAPDARFVHLRGGSSPVKENTKLKKRLPLYYYESRTRYFYQLYGWFGLTLANTFWSLGRLISKMRQICGRTDKAVSEKQWLDIWTNWLHPLKNYTHPGSTNRK